MHTGVNSNKHHYRGFTIVELLVVIVVIGILAAITIVSYTGISQKATIASLVSDLDNASRQIKLYQVTSTTGYPTSLDANYCPIPADTARCLKPSPGITYPSYIANNSITPQGFCIVANKDSTNYRITNDSAPTPGDCSEYGQVLHLDAGNTVSYSGSGAIWNDLSGNNNYGTLNGATFNPTDPKSMVFDGNDYVGAGSSDSLKLSTGGSLAIWFKINNHQAGFCNTLIMKGDAAGWASLHYILFEVSGGDGITLSLSDGTSYLAQNGPTTASLATNIWYYVVGTWDGTTKKIYLNGVLQQTVSSTIMPKDSMVSSSLNFGKTWSSAYFLDGSISDTRIFNRSLSSIEVQQGFDALRGRYGL